MVLCNKRSRNFTKKKSFLEKEYYDKRETFCPSWGRTLVAFCQKWKACSRWPFHPRWHIFLRGSRNRSIGLRQSPQRSRIDAQPSGICYRFLTNQCTDQFLYCDYRLLNDDPSCRRLGCWWLSCCLSWPACQTGSSLAGQSLRWGRSQHAHRGFPFHNLKKEEFKFKWNYYSDQKAWISRVAFEWRPLSVNGVIPPMRMLLASVWMTSTKLASPRSKRTKSGIPWNKGWAGSRAVMRPSFLFRWAFSFSPAYPAMWAPNECPMMWKSSSRPPLYS